MLNASPEPPTETPVARRIGHFAVATFGGLCALFGPRLAPLLGPEGSSDVGTLELITPSYTLAAGIFALLIGGVVLILEWPSLDSPRDTFMMALGLPALLSGTLTTAGSLQQTESVARSLQRANDLLAAEAGIPVKKQPADESEVGRFEWMPDLLPTAHAQVREAPPPSSPQGVKQQPTFGIKFSEQRYWVTLATAPTRDEAKRRAAELGSRYGVLELKERGGDHLVTLGGVPLPYSEAVRRAIKIKKKSHGAVVPELVQADKPR
jgi:hypothetical protein